MAKDTFYVTTAIDYVNAEPHIGHAYQKIAADVLARWNKILGKDVLFVTGTDEYGKKIANTAEKHNKKPQAFVNEISKKFKIAWKSLNIEYDRFIRTTDEDHQKNNILIRLTFFVLLVLFQVSFLQNLFFRKQYQNKT